MCGELWMIKKREKDIFTCCWMTLCDMIWYDMMFGGQCLFGLLGYDYLFIFVPLLPLIVAESYSNAAIVSLLLKGWIRLGFQTSFCSLNYTWITFCGFTHIQSSLTLCYHDASLQIFFFWMYILWFFDLTRFAQEQTTWCTESLTSLFYFYFHLSLHWDVGIDCQ